MLHVVVREHGKVALDQFIPITRDVTEGGYTVFFGDVRRWSQIDITDAPGVPVLVAATLLGSLGLALRLLRVRRKMLVVLRPAEPHQTMLFELSGSSEKFQQTFANELETLRVALAQRLATLGTPASDNPPLLGGASAPG